MMMVVSVRMYVNYWAIQESIQNTNEQMYSVQRQVAYLKDIRQPYLNSSYAKQAVAHENNMLSSWEVLIKFALVQTSSWSNENKTPSDYLYIKTPQESWKYFLRQKWLKIEASD